MNRLSSQNEGQQSRQEIVANGDRAVEILASLTKERVKRRLTGAQYNEANRPVSEQFTEAMRKIAQDEREVA